MRRFHVVVAVFWSLLASSQVLAQKGSAASPLSEDSRAKLRLAIPLTSSTAFDQTFSELVRQFNAIEKGFKVELIQHGTTFQNLRAVIASQYANDLPDLAIINEADLATLASLKILQPFPKEWIKQKKFISSFLTKAKCNEQASEPLCSLPFQRKTPAWYFNQELLFRLKQDPEKIPLNWKPLSGLSIKLHRPGELWGLAIPATGEFVLARWSALGLTFSANPAASAVSWVQKMRENPGNMIPGNPSSDELLKRFIEQKAVVFLGSLDQWPYIKTTVNFRTGLLLPSGNLSWFGNDVVLFAKDLRAQWAQKFLDFVYAPEQALKLYKVSNNIPVSELYLKHPAWKPALEENPLVKEVVKKSPRGLNLGFMGPSAREEWTSLLWRSLDQASTPNFTSKEAIQLKDGLEKVLSTSQR